MQKKRTQAPKTDDKEQSHLFIEKAREIGADDDKSKADEVMRRLAHKPHEPHKPLKTK